MLHLFKKTYVTLDTSIDLDYHRFVISEEAGGPLAEVLENMHPNKLLGFGTSIENLKERGTTIETMFEKCLLKNSEGYKCIIYCDKISYCSILSVWFKSLFLNIDAESSYKIIQSYFLKRSLLNFVSQRGISDDTDYFLPKKPTFEEFENIFNTTPENEGVTQLVYGLDDSKSLEYLLANYIYDGSHKEQLKTAIKRIVNRYVEEVLKETWRTIAENALLKPEFLTNLSISTKYDFDNLENIKDEEYLQPLIKANAWRILDTRYDPNRKQLDLKEYDWREILRIKNQIQAAYWEPVTHRPLPAGVSSLLARAFLYIDCLVAAEFTDEHLESILNFERNNFDHTRFWAMKDNENINCYLADYFLATKYTGEISKLEKFKLR